MANSTEWKTEFKNKNNKDFLSRTFVYDHPLKNVTVGRIPRKILGSQPSTGRTTPTPLSTPTLTSEPLTLALKQLDPLSEFAFQELDPLSKMAAEEVDTPSVKHSELSMNKKDDADRFSDMVPWSSRKQAILSKFTTSEKLSIITSFLSDGEKVMVKAQSTAVDKVQHRLEQLDTFEEGSQRQLSLSQAEYVSRIEQLNRELVSAWNSEQRVKALKIAIQCAKLLSDTDVLQFYPSKFVLVTDVLQTFGQLVYKRLRVKAQHLRPGSKNSSALPKDFTPDMVSDTAKETCLNWFYKIASIRELVPRLYVELAISKCYNFISASDCSEALLRISDMIHGIGNPLVAVYARCYLCRIGIENSNESSNYTFLLANFNGFRDSYQHLFRKGIQTELETQKMKLPTYLTLYTPGLNYILEAVACQVNRSYLIDLLIVCKKYKNSSLLLNTLMSSFNPALISERVMELLEMIEKCSDKDGLPLYLLLRTLGLCVTVCPPPLDQKKQILSIVWKMITSLKKCSEYITCVEAWIQYVAQNFSSREINIILGDIIKHMSTSRNYENHYSELKLIVNKMVYKIQDFEILLAMDNFLPLIDLFHQESIKVEVCKHILTQHSNKQKTNDPVIINSLMFLCTVLHDSVDAFIQEDEYKQIGEIICGVIRKVDHGRNFEQQLNFYVEARGAFSNIDLVLAELVQQVNTLSVNTTQVVKGMHRRKTGDFVRACAAYCFITIPSIISEKTRLELYLLSGQVALFAQSLGQADACFRAALVILADLQDITSKSETFLVPYIKQFLSTLLVVPDNPEKGVLTLLRALLNVMKNLEWNPQNGTLPSLYINVIDLLSILAQEEYPYHVDRVDSNDTLYGFDPKYVSEVNKVCSIIVDQVLILCKELGPCRRQPQIAMELFVRVATRGDLSWQPLFLLAQNLWQLSFKSEYADTTYMIKTLDYLKKTIATNHEHVQQLMNKLVI